ncbi:unnamed protein product [Ambrosiozyma monospora]|uniref:Unnamed protein product n=1 Tax=Ambrosiozyma monospora TaxID=43982 RepID=A0A9W7DHI9_AMBMO|nr:unnamed protein product [Ambrosiozyma monospora]
MSSISSVMSVAYTYNIPSDSNKPKTVRVGLGVSAPGSTVDHLRADFTVQPESFGTSYYTIDATLFSQNQQTATSSLSSSSSSSSSRAAYFAIMGGDIPTSKSVFSPALTVSDVEWGVSFSGLTSTTITPAITSPYVTMAVVAPPAMTFSKISYCAYGSDVNYLSDSAFFEGIKDGTTNTLSDTSIVYSSGLFKAFVQLTSSYDTINFSAFIEKDSGKSSYLAQLYASYLYLSTAANDNVGLQKREHTFTSSISFTTSTTIDHSSFTVTSTQIDNSVVFYSNTSSVQAITSTAVGLTTLLFTNIVTGTGESVSSTPAPNILTSSIVFNPQSTSEPQTMYSSPSDKSVSPSSTSSFESSHPAITIPFLNIPASSITDNDASPKSTGNAAITTTVAGLSESSAQTKDSSSSEESVSSPSSSSSLQITVTTSATSKSSASDTTMIGIVSNSPLSSVATSPSSSSSFESTRAMITITFSSKPASITTDNDVFIESTSPVVISSSSGSESIETYSSSSTSATATAATAATSITSHLSSVTSNTISTSTPPKLTASTTQVYQYPAAVYYGSLVSATSTSSASSTSSTRPTPAIGIVTVSSNEYSIVSTIFSSATAAVSIPYSIKASGVGNTKGIVDGSLLFMSAVFIFILF